MSLLVVVRWEDALNKTMDGTTNSKSFSPVEAGVWRPRSSISVHSDCLKKGQREVFAHYIAWYDTGATSSVSG